MNTKITLTGIIIAEILKQYNSDISFLYKEKNKDGYIGTFKCNLCDNIFTRAINSSSLKKTLCPNCQGSRSKNNIEFRKSCFLESLDNTQNFRNIMLVDGFKNQHDFARFYCKDCDSFFMQKPRAFKNARACPKCNNYTRRHLNGHTKTIENSSPYLQSLLFDKEDGKKYGVHSNKKVRWVCPKCGKITIQSIVNVDNNGLSCKFCGDGISYPNKVFANLFDVLNIKFQPEKTFDWARTPKQSYYQYDFYLPEYNYIIEAMGRQHYEDGAFYHSLKDTNENDITKKDLAISNGISEYFSINCMISDIEFIKSSILSSSLLRLLEVKDVDWNKIDTLSRKSLLIQCCKEYEENKNLLPKDLAKKFNVCEATISRYLKRGTLLGFCNYSFEECMSRFRKISVKKIDQFSIDGVYIQTFNSIIEAQRATGIKNISDAFRRNFIPSGGYVWKRHGC